MSLNVALIKESFEAVKPIALEATGYFYEILFKNYPQVIPLFKKVNIENQKKILAGSLAFIVENLENQEELVSYLKKMGARHTKYGTLPAHYPAVGDTLIRTFKHFFKDQWTTELETEWSKAYGIIADVMIQGASEAEKATPQPKTLNEIAHQIALELLENALENAMDQSFIELARRKARECLHQALVQEAESALESIKKRAA